METVSFKKSSLERNPFGKTAFKKTAALSCCLLVLHCAGFFEKAGRVLVSDKEEKSIGDMFHQRLLTNDTAQREMPVFVPKTPAEQEMQNYVQEVFRDLVQRIPANQKPNYPFQLTIIDSKMENAFAVPGGYAYITTGILQSMRDESELAGVLGHEIVHITGHHFREALAKNAALSSALQLLLIGTDAGQVGRMAAGTFNQLAGLRFSRSNEEEADKVGTLLLGASQRNPLGIAKYFQRAKRHGVPQWLSTHPGPRNRVEHVRKLVEKRPELQQLAADSARTNFSERFQAHIP